MPTPGGFLGCSVASDSLFTARPVPMCLGSTLRPLQKRGGQPVALQACEDSYRTAGLGARTGDCGSSRHPPAVPGLGLHQPRQEKSLWEEALGGGRVSQGVRRWRSPPSARLFSVFKKTLSARLILTVAL